MLVCFMTKEGLYKIKCGLKRTKEFFQSLLLYATLLVGKLHNSAIANSNMGVSVECIEKRDIRIIKMMKCAIHTVEAV
jgi:hypothetical protein